MATSAEKRAAVVRCALSREGLNQYTQGAKRDQVGSGWSDCSSFVAWCYKQGAKLGIGSNTANQITNKKLQAVEDSRDAEGSVPPREHMLPGDLVFFKGSDPSKPRGCGHVEMYLGKNKCIGHGSGKGPTVKNFANYCKNRASKKRGWLCVLRPIKDDGTRGELEKEVILITGKNGASVRSGPGSEFAALGKAKKGERFERGEKSPKAGWRGIQYKGAQGYVSTKYTKKV